MVRAVSPAPGGSGREICPARDAAPRHVAFGWGAHFCIGAPLARMELLVAMEELAAAFPELAVDAEPHFRPVFPLRALDSLWLRHCMVTTS